MVSRGALPLLTSPSNTAAPPIVTPPSAKLFDMTTARSGVPGVNDQFENFGAERDWAAGFAHPTEGFAGVRWCPAWVRMDGFWGSWEPANADIYRVQRKGASGQDAQTLVFTCSPNTAAIPAGEKVVVWYATSDSGVDKTGSYNLSGYNLPTRQKLTVTACTPSAANDADGRRIIEVAAGTALPAIDFSPAWFDGQYTAKSRLQLRHWAFYSNTAAKQLRHPIGWFADVTTSSVLAGGGYCIVGGHQWSPTYYDWTTDYNNFGASLVEELYRLECEGLANYLGATDPKRLAVELENEPTSDWAASGGNAGYGALLRDVFYPTARTAWGADRTLILKSTSYGSLGSLISEFDLTCPSPGANAHLSIHNMDGQITWPNGQVNFGDITQTDWVADQLKQRITTLGYAGGGATVIGTYPYEFWDNTAVVNDAERGRRLGRVLTSMTSKGLYMFAWGNVSDSLRCAGVRSIDGKNIEAYLSGISPYARRAGVTIS